MHCHTKIGPIQKWFPGPILVAKSGLILPKLAPNLATKIGPGDHFWQSKVVPRNSLGCYEWSCFPILTAEKAKANYMQAIYIKQKGHSYLCF